MALRHTPASMRAAHGDDLAACDGLLSLCAGLSQRATASRCATPHAPSAWSRPHVPRAVVWSMRAVGLALAALHANCRQRWIWWWVGRASNSLDSRTEHPAFDKHAEELIGASAL